MLVMLTIQGNTALHLVLLGGGLIFSFVVAQHGAQFLFYCALLVFSFWHSSPSLVCRLFINIYIAQILKTIRRPFYTVGFAVYAVRLQCHGRYVCRTIFTRRASIQRSRVTSDFEVLIFMAFILWWVRASLELIWGGFLNYEGEGSLIIAPKERILELFLVPQDDICACFQW